MSTGFPPNIHMISTGALRRFVMALLMLVSTAIGALAQADRSDTTLLRVFLKSGSTLVSYGEFSRVGDHVVISIPVQLDPLKLQVISIPDDRVDWARTDAYNDSARAARYAVTRGPDEYAALNRLVSQQLADINATEDRDRKIALATAARQNLTKWLSEHFGYHAKDVAQMEAWFDEIIAKAQNASGKPNFELSLVAANAVPPSVPLLPTPDSATVLRQSFEAAKLVDSAADRISLLRAIRDALQTQPGDSALAPLRAAVTKTIAEEEKTTSTYSTYVRQVLHAAARLAAKADVQALIDMAARILEDDDKMGHKRPDEVASLLAAVDAKLEAARELRLTRDQWEAQRQQRYAYYRAIEIPERALRLSRSALTAIQQLAGPAPDVLGRAKTRLTMAHDILKMVKPPTQMEPVHALMVGAMQLATRAVENRFAAVQGGGMQQARDAASAAGGALLLFDRATEEIQRMEAVPQLK